MKLASASPACVVFLLSLASPSIALEIKCPGSIIERPVVSINEDQWAIVAAQEERPVESVGVYLGTLSEHGAQVPDSTSSSKAKEIVIWNITQSSGDTFWVGCSFSGTTAMLFQKLDANIHQCRASYDLLASGKRQRLHMMECQ